MSIAALGGSVLRQVPAELLRGLGTEYQLHGSVIRSLSTGRIVGHLQETSALRHALGSSSGLAPGRMAIDVAAQAVTVIQNEQIKSALAVVQSLQRANLAVGVASIGVSLAGTAILSRQIKQVEAKLDKLLPQLEALARAVDALRRERIAEDFTRLTTLIAELDECWLLTSQAQNEWRVIAREAHVLADTFERRSLELLDDRANDPVIAEPFVEALAISSSLRVIARMAADDGEAALQAATRQAEALAHVGNRVQLDHAVLFKMRKSAGLAGTVKWNTELDQTIETRRPMVTQIRQWELSAAGAAATLAELNGRGISTREWLDAARAEEDEPLLFLPHDEGQPSALPRP